MGAERTRVESALSQERLRAAARFQRRARAMFDNQKPVDLYGACVEFDEAVKYAVARELAAACRRFPDLDPADIRFRRDGGRRRGNRGRRTPGKRGPRRRRRIEARAGGLGRRILGYRQYRRQEDLPEDAGPLCTAFRGADCRGRIGLWQYYFARAREQETNEAMQGAVRRWADYIAELADRLNDEAKEIVRRSVDDTFAPAEAPLRAAREGLKEEARAMAEDRAILNVCRERVKRHLEAMLPVPPAA